MPRRASINISIHSPHAWRDRSLMYLRTFLTNFNPLSSCEERRVISKVINIVQIFQSTLLMRGETCTEKDCEYCPIFQSTLLMRGETNVSMTYFIIKEISIHSPHARRDHQHQFQVIFQLISIHSPHARRDTLQQMNLLDQ